MMDGVRSSPSPDWKKVKKRPKDISKFIRIGVARGDPHSKRQKERM